MRREKARRRPILYTVTVGALLFFLWSPAPRTAVPTDAPWPVIDAPASADLTAYEPISVSVYHKDTGAVEQMDFEEYIVGVVSGEMPASYETEALKAQAVAARTYAYRKIRTGGCGRGGAHVCTDSTHCQAYCTLEQRKAKWGNNFEQHEAKIRAAVMDTRGQILVYGGEPIAAFFHAVSGGQTEDVVNVWGGNLPYLKSVKSEGEETASRYSRTVTVSADAFRKTIRAEYPDARVDDVAKSLGSVKRTDSGRVSAMVIGGESISGTKMRTLFGLDSTNFTISCKGGKVTFTTRGYGHGVGMSQVGALSMAKNGSDYKEILMHYYTGVELTTIKNVK